ncbi:hypothetical protein TNCV_2458741 [Trichonephila clavipes]|nr:hypothetical protein TNCV_2458741 [Trichonephila clavipes]
MFIVENDELFINAAIQTNLRAIGNGTPNSEPGTSDKEDTRADIYYGSCCDNMSKRRLKNIDKFNVY